MTLQALRAIEEADLVIGAARLQQDLKDLTEGKETVSAYRAEEILQILENRDYEKAVILFSGDIGFYSGAGKLSALAYELVCVQKPSALAAFLVRGGCLQDDRPVWPRRCRICANWRLRHDFNLGNANCALTVCCSDAV
jgi:precorrin-6B methylase 1